MRQESPRADAVPGHRVGPDRLRGRRRPTFERLEDRALLSRGGVPDAFLFTPIPDGAPLAEHIHPHLRILIDGAPVTIPAGIGLGPAGNLPLHTHDASGTIHVESTQALMFDLGDFFKIWGQTFNPHDLLGHRADVRHRITMTVDGQPSRAFGSLPLADRQDIVIRFTTATPHVHGHPGRVRRS